MLQAKTSVIEYWLQSRILDIDESVVDICNWRTGADTADTLISIKAQLLMELIRTAANYIT